MILKEILHAQTPYNFLDFQSEFDKEQVESIWREDFIVLAPHEQCQNP